MNSPSRNLSDVCKNARVLDLETETVWKYSEVEVEPSSSGYHRSNPPTRYYVIYWPFGIFAYVATHFELAELQPSFIEAAFKSARKPKPFSPPMSRWWK